MLIKSIPSLFVCRFAPVRIKKYGGRKCSHSKFLSKDPVYPKPYEGCALKKSHRQPFPNSGRRRATKIGEINHSDPCGPMSVPSFTGFRYYVLFQDDASGFQLTVKPSIILKSMLLESLLKRNIVSQFWVLIMRGGM
jgi:hypothetical protein